MFKQRIPFHAFTDAQWEALRPHLAHDAPQGRPIGDLRHRMEGMFHLIATDAPWREVRPEYGAAASIARHYRRLTHAGLWERLLNALHAQPANRALHELARLIFRGARRAYRLRGLGLIVVARRLGFILALPGPGWMVADPDLSKKLIAWQMAHLKNFGPFVREWGKTLRNLMGMVGGRPNMPRRLRLMMR